MYKIIARNNKANFNYIIENKIEAGIILTGDEVKSLRCFKVSINESYIRYTSNHVSIYKMYIPTFNKSCILSNNPIKCRKLLLHKKEIIELTRLVQKKKYVITPLSLYFNKNNIAKILIGLGINKKKSNVKQIIKEKEFSKRKAKELNFFY